MRIALSSPVRTRAFLSGCAGLILVAFALSLQAIVEQQLLAHATLQGLTLARRIQPMNADTEARLGDLRMENGQFQEAAAHYERAVVINPHEARFWLALADSCNVLGDDGRRADAVRHAIAAEPRDTEVEWQAANLFINSDLDRSLQLLRGVVENNPKYAPAAMQVAYFASQQKVGKAMLAIPLQTSSRLQFMRWLIEREHYDDVDQVWPTLLRAPGQLQATDVFFYFDSLIDRHQSQQARTAWLALADRDPLMRAHLQPANLIFNGDFEGDLLNGGFDWRYSPTTGVSANLDTSTFHGGSRSLSFQIDTEDVQDLGFRQFVKVDPGAHYRLSAWLHAEELEAAYGIKIAVQDAYSRSPLLLCDDALGSFPWREVDANFVVPAGTELVTVSFVRSPSMGRIRGKLWVDDVRIEQQ